MFFRMSSVWCSLDSAAYLNVDVVRKAGDSIGQGINHQSPHRAQVYILMHWTLH